MTSEKIIIGISGKARSGKDQVCQYLLDLFGHEAKRVAFGDQLKEEAKEMGWSPENKNESAVSVIERFKKDNLGKPYPGCVFCIDKISEDISFLQWWGTEFRRKIYSNNYWVDALKNKIEDMEKKIIIIPDVRFPNEWLFCRSNGVVIRVDRGYLDDERSKTHLSEISLDDFFFDFLINNDSDLKELLKKTKSIFQSLKHRIKNVEEAKINMH